MLKIEEIEKLISDDKASTLKTAARVGQRYYEGDHDILKSEIYYIDANGQLQKDKFRSNIKISHPFFTELVDQQVQYMLSGGENIFRSDNPELQTILDEYFDDDFYSEVYDLLTGTVSKGFEYLYAVIDDEGKTRFETADCLGVVEVRARDTDDGCRHLIYYYTDRIEKGQKKIIRIQVWDDERIYFYVQDGVDGKVIPDDCCLMPDGTAVNYRPHTIMTKGKRVLGKGYGFIPFWRLDNGKKRFSGLKPVKGLIDDYDLMACSLSNNLQDFNDAIYVVSGFKGHNLDELLMNVKAKKHIGVEPGGGLDIKTVDIPYQARKAKLELDETNIYRFGMGFNSAQVGDGNITNIVIKSRYALLDMKCNKLEIRLKQLFRKILQVVLDEVNEQQGKDFRPEQVYFKFDREIMTNASDNAQIELTDAQKAQVEVQTVLSLQNIIDNETIVQMICEILDIDYEEIKDKLPKDEYADNQQAIDTLNQVVPEEGGAA